MSFRNIKLKNSRSYSSEKDDILNSFYIPVLKEAISYKRIAGYFSSSSFLIAAKGFAEFIQKQGKSQFIVNVVLQPEDYNQITSGKLTAEEIIENRFLSDLKKIENECLKNHVKVLGWLIANNLLEIRVGYIENQVTGHDILHQKIGILEDSDGNIISFVGSNNESASGWLFNSEKFKIFLNWVEHDKESIAEDIQEFDDLWNNLSPKTRVIPLPQAFQRDLIRSAEGHEKDVITIIHSLEGDARKSGVNLRPYQKAAIEAWFLNRCHGIFEMATGTGKTITAIEALKMLSKQQKQLVTIICCPFIHLIDQWHEALKNMNIGIPIIEAHGLNKNWKNEVVQKVHEIKMGRANNSIILTTHDTVSSDSFIELINREVNFPILLIADEVHGMGALNRSKSLLSQYNFRLGLSATPSRYYDEIGTKKLLNFFGKTVYKFDLHQALTEINPDTNQTYLAPYYYYPHFVELTADEMIEYEALTRQITRLFFKKDRTYDEDEMLEMIIFKRQRILKNAQNKIFTFKKIVDDLEKSSNISHTLVYCSPEQIDKTQRIIRTWEGKILQHKFTFDEDKPTRQKLLTHFDNGDIDVLVAIKCLDEGLDVPSTKNAILLCSSGNPREYIQRRGRVLRRYPGKDHAIIYDLIAVPNKKYRIDSDNERKLIEKELRRLFLFAEDAINEKEIVSTIEDTINKYIK